MSYGDTLLIDGTDVRALPGVVAVGFIDGLYAPGTRRGDDDTIPGRQGQLGVLLPADKYLITVPISVAGSTTAQLNANLHSIGSAVAGSGGLVTLTRKLANGSGFDSHTANGRFVQGLQFTLMNWTTAQTDLQFYNLDGAWWTGTSWRLP